MNGFIFALACFTLIVAANAQPVDEVVEKPQGFRNGVPVFYNHKPGNKCPAVPEFWDDCNHCNCLDGIHAACTLILCPSREAITTPPPAKEDIPVIDDYVPGQKCPAPFFYDKCNFCRCGKDGILAACTLKECRPTTLVVDVKEIENKKSNQ